MSHAAARGVAFCHGLLGVLLVAGLAVPPAASAADDEPVQLGPLSREELEAANPSWVLAQAQSELDPEAARRLAAADPATVTVYLGTWCSDSRREISRLWRALDELDGPVPFEVRYVGVDRDKVEPEALLAGREIGLVPTFVVERDGRELGRVVELSLRGIEVDLADLLHGVASGPLGAAVPAQREGDGGG